jgi:signal transduction histidine kinase
LNNIIEFSKIQAGSITISRKQTPKGILFDELKSKLEQLTKPKNIENELIIDKRINELLIIDFNKLMFVLLEIIGNAVKFTSEGKILIEVQQTGSYLYIGISDTGIGIEPIRLPTIFEGFNQETNVDTKRQSGAGLGLAISKKLLEKMEGEIKIESTSNEGTNVLIKILCV